MFHVGQKVICVDTNIRPETKHSQQLNKIRVGNTYHIAKINKIGVQLVEIEPAHENNYFFTDRFRPLVRKTDISILEELLKSNVSEGMPKSKTNANV